MNEQLTRMLQERGVDVEKARITFPPHAVEQQTLTVWVDGESFAITIPGKFTIADVADRVVKKIMELQMGGFDSPHRFQQKG